MNPKYLIIQLIDLSLSLNETKMVLEIQTFKSVISKGVAYHLRSFISDILSSIEK